MYLSRHQQQVHQVLFAVKTYAKSGQDVDKKVRSPATGHNPWSQHLTKGQANVMKSLTVEGWFAQRQSELETEAYAKMHKA